MIFLINGLAHPGEKERRAEPTNHLYIPPNRFRLYTEPLVDIEH